MQNIQERKQALESLLQQRLSQLQQLDAQKNEIATDAIKIQGKLEILKELEYEGKVDSKLENK